MLKAYDVVIMGGGLSGLTLAIQLKRRIVNLRILIAEKAAYPMPEAAHKVGESSVEIASYYFDKILGLKAELEKELPKLGLRFFYSYQGNQDIEQRIELGPSTFPASKSYQIDRGRFENSLIQRCQKLGVDFQGSCKIKDFTLGKNDHQINLLKNDQEISLRSKWLIDASGRMSLLKRKLKLTKPAYHDLNASWFRINHQFKVDDWVSSQGWQDRVQEPRWLSTNHLLGKGYWVWIIPLASGATSIGIVADPKFHPYAEFNTFERAMQWLKKYEPQFARIIAPHLDAFQDFLTLKHYSYNCKKMFSADGWAITGDAGVFLDPFYSPGSDFIAMNNCFITEQVVKQYAGEDIALQAAQYEKIFRTLFLAFGPVYEDQYAIMGNAKVMSIKVIWDFTLYWSGIALLFFRNKLTDLKFMQSAAIQLQQIYQLNIQVQGFFREWAGVDLSTDEMSHTFINYSYIGFVQQLNKDLHKELTDAELEQQLVQNIAFIKELANEIATEVTGFYPELKEYAPEMQERSSNHLQDVFAQLGSRL
ncbi:MAG: tryptophan 7-halogenase [Methyloprofundus sp.]|uniref:NAD(P)/FAD-dependent oxidoreductase n=1 Tax=Methyloprofundus sp. TaxID=2020875 RepID=UPI00260DFE93|nr:tryptophan 7-halogenase [Methyloprofundus sp.]